MFSELSGLFSNPIFSMLGIEASSSGSKGSPLYGGDGWGPDKLMGGGGIGGNGMNLGDLLVLSALGRIFGMEEANNAPLSSGDQTQPSSGSGNEHYVRSNGDLLDGAATEMSSIRMGPIE